MKPRSTLKLLPPQGGVGAWSLWALRWVLVLAVVMDLVGSPLHRHRHDFGMDAIELSAAEPHGDHALSQQEEHDHDNGPGHSTLALRAGGDVSKTASADDLLGDATLAFIASAWVVLALPALDDEGHTRPYHSWRAPPKPSYRSLPPAGRAPPLHA